MNVAKKSGKVMPGESSTKTVRVVFVIDPIRHYQNYYLLANKPLTYH